MCSLKRLSRKSLPRQAPQYGALLNPKQKNPSLTKEECPLWIRKSRRLASTETHCVVFLFWWERLLGPVSGLKSGRRARSPRSVEVGGPAHPTSSSTEDQSCRRGVLQVPETGAGQASGVPRGVQSERPGPAHGGQRRALARKGGEGKPGGPRPRATGGAAHLPSSQGSAAAFLREGNIAGATAAHGVAPRRQAARPPGLRGASASRPPPRGRTPQPGPSGFRSERLRGRSGPGGPRLGPAGSGSGLAFGSRL